MKPTNGIAECMMSSRSVLDQLIHTLLPARSDKGKEKEIKIDAQMLPLYKQAHRKTQRMMNELPARLRAAAHYNDAFSDTVADYRRLYDKCQRNGDLQKLEVLTACFDFSGALDLVGSIIDIDVLVAYTLQQQCISGRPDADVTFEFYVGSEANVPELFETPGIEFDELRNYYVHCVPEHGASYWLCNTSGWYYSSDCAYNFLINQRQLTDEQMWREITLAYKQGHSLHDEDGELLTRTELAQQLNNA